MKRFIVWIVCVVCVLTLFGCTRPAEKLHVPTYKQMLTALNVELTQEQIQNESYRNRPWGFVS